MGKKYLIDHMHIRHIDQIRCCCPTTLQERDYGPELGTLCDNADSAETCMLLLNLAHEVGLLSVMPFALYMLGLDARGVLTGWRDHDDGTTVKLVPEIQTRLLIGRDWLLNNRVDGIYSWTMAEVDGCKAPSECRCAKRTRLLEFLDTPVEDACYLSPWEPHWEAGLCSACIKHAKATHESSREELWEKLPSVWDLPSWGEIRRLEHLK